MNDTNAANQPTIYPATGDEVRRSPWRLTVIALLLMGALGAIGGGWLVHWFEQREQAAQPAPARPQPATAAQVARPSRLAAVGAPAVVPANMADRLSSLEERLGRISIAAESASGNAARAEAVLIAFAARRAVERGLPLGTMEAQLRLRFGETQPNAVASILSASADPVTTDQLLQRLDALRPQLISGDGDGWFARMRRSIAALGTVRSSDAPNPAPGRRYDRARWALQSHLVDQAIMEVEAMPGSESAEVQLWLNDARRYNDACRALDLIETAAILEPGHVRADVALPTRAAPRTNMPAPAVSAALP